MSVEAAIDALPSPLREPVATAWRDWAAANGELATRLAASPLAAELPRVWAASRFVQQACERHPEMLAELLDEDALTRARGNDELAVRLSPLLTGPTDRDALHAVLRRQRRREMVRIAWRDLAGRAALEETLRDLSILAEVLIAGALDWLYAALCGEMGVPHGGGAAGETGDAAGPGAPQQMVVLAMGKLGAGELNFSSDVDLIFAYPEDGETVPAAGQTRAWANSEFFARLGRELIEALDRRTADGFVFRVDMRLRPFGDSGPLVSSFDAMEHYYQAHGREWERYAMIKARVVAGDRAAGERLTAMLRPFVYRRYVDFGAFESLREMKALIVREVARKGLEDNIKLGAGGIREVEFIAQAFQLIRGGAEPALQERRLLDVLATLAARDYLPDYVVAELREAYVFLRNCEHRLQEYEDQQTHVLPGDETARLRLAWSLGFADWEACAAVLRAHRERVRQHFEQVFAAPQLGEAGEGASPWLAVWSGATEEAEAVGLLAGAGYEDPAEVLRRLALLRDSRSTGLLSAQGRARLDDLMPLLIGAAAATPQPDAALLRALELVEAIGRRSVYLALLAENPMALSQLVKLCAASPWIARFLAGHPMLLDELLDPRSLYHPPERAAMAEELRARLAQLAPEDEERLVDALRHFKQSTELRVAAADIAGALPLTEVSNHLTWLAEVILEAVLDLAWRHMTARHGRPVCDAAGSLCDTGFAVVAYGKLGGLELGYGSDLDLVFVHAGQDPNAMTTGEHPLAVPVFFARLGQRMIHILTVRTAAGQLYEVDMRLRPNGASGMLVSSFGAFEAYQREKAWTWEKQALVRARVVAGDPLIAAEFDRIRREVLGERREPEVLRREVRDMREKMRRAKSAAKPGQFDLKQDRGGIADIEFMVQYGVLAWAADHPELLDFTDNIRILEGFAAAGLMPRADTDVLSEAYQTFRNRIHRLKLQARPAVVAAEEYAELRGQVRRLWARWMEDGEDTNA